MLDRERIRDVLKQITSELTSHDEMETSAADIFAKLFPHMTRERIVELFSASKQAGLTMKRPNDFLLPAVIIISDQNGDGNISTTELHDVMAMYNWIPAGISKEEVDKMIAETRQSLDVNKDGIITPKELLFGIMKKIHIERKFYN